MVEVVTPKSKIHDLTEAPRYVPIEVDGSSVYEVFATIWTVYNEKQKPSSFEFGAEWQQNVIDSTSEDLTDEIATLGGPYCSVWLSLLGLVASAPRPHTPDNVFEWLSKINPDRLGRWMLAYFGQWADLSLIERAAEGDFDAVREIVGKEKPEEMVDHFVALFEIDPEELRDRLTATLIEFHDKVFTKHASEFPGAISRAAAARRAMASRDDVKTVIEEVTNGLEYEVPLGVKRVILVPSVVVRPLSLIDQQRDTLLVMYAVADEFLDSDPEAPPSWLVRTYKALSDERRLRILRRIGEGETTLDELTEMLGLSKSTVHHHISILRGAGLVRIHVPSEGKMHKTSTYGLRLQALDGAGQALHAYLGNTETSSQKEMSLS